MKPDTFVIAVCGEAAIQESGADSKQGLEQHERQSRRDLRRCIVMPSRFGDKLTSLYNDENFDT
jgi:hypothetical protein